MVGSRSELSARGLDRGIFTELEDEAVCSEYCKSNCDTVAANRVATQDSQSLVGSSWCGAGWVVP